MSEPEPESPQGKGAHSEQGSQGPPPAKKTKLPSRKKTKPLAPKEKTKLPPKKKPSAQAPTKKLPPKKRPKSASLPQAILPERKKPTKPPEAEDQEASASEASSKKEGPAISEVSEKEEGRAEVAEEEAQLTELFAEKAAAWAGRHGRWVALGISLLTAFIWNEQRRNRLAVEFLDEAIFPFAEKTKENPVDSLSPAERLAFEFLTSRSGRERAGRFLQESSEQIEAVLEIEDLLEQWGPFDWVGRFGKDRQGAELFLAYGEFQEARHPLWIRVLTEFSEPVIDPLPTRSFLARDFQRLLAGDSTQQQPVAALAKPLPGGLLGFKDDSLSSTQATTLPSLEVGKVAAFLSTWQPVWLVGRSAKGPGGRVKELIIEEIQVGWERGD